MIKKLLKYIIALVIGFVLAILLLRKKAKGTTGAGTGTGKSATDWPEQYKGNSVFMPDWDTDLYD